MKSHHSQKHPRKSVAECNLSLKCVLTKKLFEEHFLKPSLHKSHAHSTVTHR